MHQLVFVTVFVVGDAPAHVGALLREWRAARRMSQLDLALEAGVSARHMSCVETGKAQPSREMVMRLADTLDMPLRERNALLVAAGYAPKYPQSRRSRRRRSPRCAARSSSSSRSRSHIRRSCSIATGMC